MTANSPYLTATVKETSRSPGHAAYELDVQLKDGAPAGYLKDQLTLATNGSALDRVSGNRGRPGRLGSDREPHVVDARHAATRPESDQTNRRQGSQAVQDRGDSLRKPRL